jgi:hypothetical protein
MVRHVERVRVPGFQDDLPDRELQHIQDAARVPAGFQQFGQDVEGFNLALAHHGRGQFGGFLLVDRLGVAQHG